MHQESKDELWGRLGEVSVMQPWRCSLGASSILMVMELWVHEVRTGEELEGGRRA